MGLYTNALDIYASAVTLSHGTTYSHSYKAIIERTNRLMRSVRNIVDISQISTAKELIGIIDGERRKLEIILRKIYPAVSDIISILASGDKKNSSLSFGALDAETDDIGSVLVANILEMPGSVSLTLKRLLGLLNSIRKV